jgi:hypothetical protein
VQFWIEKKVLFGRQGNGFKEEEMKDKFLAGILGP